MFRIFLAALLLALPAPLVAQEAPKTILVLDGSGSMWGQIDGVNKIVIAREVMTDLLATLPPEQELGLMSYGHRRKGDCNDIELLIEPGTDRAAIAAAVNAISPKGKTPLSAAVIQAAEALRYSEEAATVILVSDGIETCNLDPCAVGRELEAVGVNFTAHVIGFDVADPAALAQLQCLAEETGGMFRTAANADELAQALEVVAAPPPLPVSIVVDFRALDGVDGPVITNGLLWNISTEDAGAIIVNDTAATERLDIFPSTGTASVLRMADEATAEASFTVSKGDGPKTVTLVLPEFLPAATVSGPETAPFGATIPVTWTGPNAANDHITIVPVGAKDGALDGNAYTAKGNPAQIRLPMETGAYEIRYLLSDGTKVLARQPITLTEVTATLDAPATIAIGEEISVGWSGPDYDRDYISITQPGAVDSAHETYAYTGNGNPARFKVPSTPGTYELRYVANDNGTRVIARQPLIVTEVKASLDAPITGVAGSTIQIGWDGPEGQRDYVSIAKDRAADSRYEAYTYIKDGNPVSLILPLTPGTYELRYVLNQDTKVLARQAITVTPVSASLDAPATASAGSMIAIDWTGPDYNRDYLSIAKSGQPDTAYIAYRYTKDGKPGAIQAPAEPGAYELRYVANGNPDMVLARRDITVTPTGATLDAPASAPAGSQLSVGWTGPEESRNYITIAKPEAPAHAYETYTYVEKGSPLAVQVPSAPGDYELRFILTSDTDTIIARQPFTVTPETATLDAPDSAPAGSQLSVAWTGPNDNRNYITLAKPGTPASSEETYAYVDKGSPLSLLVPSAPGEYELRFVLRGDDKTIIARKPLTVTPETATLDAPASALAGSDVSVAWTGPNDNRNYITIAKPDQPANTEVTYAYVDKGTPLTVQAPALPGDYELRFILRGDDKTIIARQPITIAPQTATLEAPASAPVGSNIDVSWTGPNVNNDYITIAKVDQPAGSEVTYEYCKKGSPLSIAMPDAPGDYELRYIMRGNIKTILARQPITATPQ